MANATYSGVMDSPGATGSPERLQQAAGNVADQATRTAQRQASRAMDQAGDTLDRVAEAVRQTAQQLQAEQPQIAGVADTAAQRLQDGARYLREHEARHVLEDADRFARRQPALVVAGGLALGLVLGRLLRSGAEMGQTSMTHSHSVRGATSRTPSLEPATSGNGRTSGTLQASGSTTPVTAPQVRSTSTLSGTTPGSATTSSQPRPDASRTTSPIGDPSASQRVTGSSEAG